MKLSLPASLTLLLLSTPFAVPALAQKTALVIGNSTYGAACGPNAPGAAVDARNVSDMLKTAGWRVVQRGNLTEAEIRQEIANNIPAAPSLYLIWYSGHGLVGAGAQGRLVGVDCVAVTPVNFRAALINAQGNAKDRTIVILNSCGSGGFATSTQDANNLPAFLTATSNENQCAFRTDAGGDFTNAVRAGALTGGPITLQQISTRLSQAGGYDQLFMPPVPHFFNGTLPNAVIANSPGNLGCQPGVAGVIQCPCANPPGELRRGCNNSSNTRGAQLMAVGNPSLGADTLTFSTLDEKPTATSIVLEGPLMLAQSVVFGQGVRCVQGGLRRLYTKNAIAGSITAPSGTNSSVHVRSAQLGDPLFAGNTRYYMVDYRDPTVLGGCPAASKFNSTTSLAVTWVP